MTFTVFAITLFDALLHGFVGITPETRLLFFAGRDFTLQSLFVNTPDVLTAIFAIAFRDALLHGFVGFICLLCELFVLLGDAAGILELTETLAAVFAVVLMPAEKHVPVSIAVDGSLSPF